VYTAVPPGHGADGRVTDVGAVGAAPRVAVNEYAELVPHPLTALTVTVAEPAPAVKVIALVVLVPLHPVPLTVQT
jgi:hypothetical protein